VTLNANLMSTTEYSGYASLHANRQTDRQTDENINRDTDT